MVSFEKNGIVAMARKRNWSDTDILRLVVQGTRGDKRREIIVEWAGALGLTPNDALQLARRASLIPTSAPPREIGKGKPQRKTQGKTS
jgi:hypothetical protein